MKALIYTRVMPNNQKVQKSDQLAAQEKRCRDFAREFYLEVQRVYPDQGPMNPPYFLPGINSLCDYLKQRNGGFIVIADHPGRLGVKEDVRRMVLKRIEEAGGQFLSVHNAKSSFVESFVADILQTLNEMESPNEKI